MTVPTFTLSDRRTIPAISYGIGTKWFNSGENIDPEVIKSLKNAYDLGFRHFDGAEVYNTERELGEAIKGKKREDLFITTKLKPSSGNDVQAHFDESLKKIGVEYVDLYLIHAPFKADIIRQWTEVEKIYESGRAKSIGVSNFRVSDLKAILQIAKIKPSVNQIEYHAYLQNQSPGIYDFAREKGILLAAYGPLTPIVRAKGEGPIDELLRELSVKYGKNAGQILLRWVYERGVLPITTSAKPDHITEALDVFTFELEKEDHEKITKTGGSFHYRAFWKDADWNGDKL